MNPLNGVRVASVFRNGRNQAIRLPRDMELNADQVLIERHGDVLTIRPRPRDWDHYFATCPSFDPDFPSDIDDLPAEEEAPGW
jgi:antitoxin VapB